MLVDTALGNERHSAAGFQRTTVLMQVSDEDEFASILSWLLSNEH